MVNNLSTSFPFLVIVSILLTLLLITAWRLPVCNSYKIQKQPLPLLPPCTHTRLHILRFPLH